MSFYHGSLRHTDSWTWHRRTIASQRRHVHMLAEQAVVQWALDYCSGDAALMELAAMVLRLQAQRTSNDDNDDDPEALPRLLIKHAERADGDGTFAKKVLLALEDGKHNEEENSYKSITSPVSENARKRRRVSP